MLQCIMSEFEPGACPPSGKNGLGTGALGVGGGVAVSMASTSTLSGYAATRSMSERAASGIPRSVAPGASSAGGAVNRRVTSTTAALSGPYASTLSDAMTGANVDAATASAISLVESATTS